jgi:hypothetical protein
MFYKKKTSITLSSIALKNTGKTLYGVTDVVLVIFISRNVYSRFINILNLVYFLAGL